MTDLVPPASVPAATAEPDDDGSESGEEFDAAYWPAAPSGEEADDAANLAGLITMCRDLKARLVPFGASESGWDSAIATLERATAQATELAALRARVEDAARRIDGEFISREQAAALVRAALAPHD